MTINYDWYTTNYRHAAVYATLIVKVTVYNKPFTFLKNRSTLFLKISGTISYFPERTDKVSKFRTVPDNQGRMACMLKLSSANSFNLEESEICCLGKGKNIFPR